jgi:hypothetical protein
MARRKSDSPQKAALREMMSNYMRDNDVHIKDGTDVNSLMRDMMSVILEGTLDAEMDEELGYSKYDYKNKDTENSRNGYSQKTMHTSYGDMEIDVPRDRKGEFEPQVVKKYQNTVTQDMEEKIISMYAKGMTTADIESHMRDLYDIEISDSTISRITDKILPIVKEWQERPLEEVYAVVFMDAIHYHVRSEGRIVKRAVYIAIGIDYRLYIQQVKKSAEGLTRRNFAESYATAIQMGVEDLFDATAFVIAKAEEWKADTSIVVISGCSAGAINSATAEYLICNDHPMATSRLPQGFNYRAVVPFAGGIWLTDCKELTWKRRTCPYVAFHGTSDELVPYDFATIGEGKFSTFGPAHYMQQLEEMQVPYMFHTYVGDTHGIAGFYDKRWARQEMKNALARMIWWNEKIRLRINDARYDRTHVDRTLEDGLRKMGMKD